MITWGQLANQPELEIPYLGVSIDTRTIQPGQAFFCIKGHQLDGHDFAEMAVQKGASVLITERKLNLGIPEILVENTTQAMADFASSYRRFFNIPVLALTGSCGKTGTKEMMAAICREVGETLSTQGNLNNQWGVPLTLFQLKPSHQFAVIEMGTSAPGEIEFLAKTAQPTVSLITNIRHQHVEGMGSLAGISQEKSNIFKYLSPTGIAIVNQDEKFANDWKILIKTGFSQRKIMTFGQGNSADIFASQIRQSLTGVMFRLHTPLGEIDLEVPLLGKHVVQNTVAASAMALGVGISLAQIQKGLMKIQPTPGRLCPHVLAQNILLIDDTYNASPSAVESAVDWLGHYAGKKIFVMSNMAALADQNDFYHAEMGRWILEAGIDQALFYGNLDCLKPALKIAGAVAKFYSDKESLLADLTQILEPNAVVLMKGSRGNQMESLVKALLEKSQREVIC